MTVGSKPGPREQQLREMREQQTAQRETRIKERDRRQTHSSYVPESKKNWRKQLAGHKANSKRRKP